MIEIRALGADDWALTRALRLAALVDSPEAFGGTYAESVQRSAEQWREWPRDGQVFAAVVDGEPVGMGCGWRPPGASGTHLIGMWIAPAARGTGLAPRLIDAVAQWARGNGSDALDSSGGYTQGWALPTWAGAYGQVDASVSYKVTDKFSIGLEGQNLFNAIYKQEMQQHIGMMGRAWFSTGPRYTAQATYSF